MPISDIWTLEPDGSPEEAATLSARGFASASLTRASQVAARLVGSIPNGAAMSMDLGEYTWASAWVLRRDGAIVFRGYLAEVPRREGSATGEQLTLTFADLWWKLDRTDYTQEWKHGAGVSLADQRTTRARLAWNAATGVRSTTADALTAIVAAATHAGLSLTLDLTAFNALTPPPIEAMNKKCGELLRDVLRWHPECSARIVPGEGGDVLTVVDRSEADVVEINLSDEELESAEIARRDDLVVDSVHVTYEAEMARSAEIPGSGGAPDVLRTRNRLAIFSDVYPEASSLTWRSFAVTLPWRAGQGGATQPPAPILPQRVPVTTRPLPVTGAYDTDAEKFWLKMLDLESLGLTSADIKLPTSTVGTIQAHTLAFAHPADDPNDPLFEQPSVINPAATPVWRPSTVADLPRYLVEGTLHEWMRVKAADVRATATVAVAKASVNALSARNRALFMEKRPVPATVQTVDSWLIEGNVVVRGTDAQTRPYVNWAGTGSSYNPATENAAASGEAEANVVIPELAQKLYTPRSIAPYEGTVTLMAEECAEASHLLSVIRLVHADRSDWTTMRALVQQESLDLATGSTSLSLGLPNHLSPSDIVALYEAPRLAAGGGGGGGMTRPPDPPSAAEEEEEGTESARSGGVFHGSVGPVVRNESRGIGDFGLWGIVVTDAVAGKFRLINPGTIKKTAAYDASGLVAVTGIGTEFTGAADHSLVLKVEPDLTITLELAANSWTGWPLPLESEETSPAGNWVMKYYRLTLWDLVSSTDDPNAVKLKTGLFAEFRGYRDNLQLFSTDMEDIGGRVMPAQELLPSTGCRRS